MTEHYKLPADTTDQLDAIFAIAGEELTISAWYAVCVAELKKRLQAAKKSDATVLKSPLISLGTPDEPGDTTPPVGQIAA
jgi:hypothetical protein